MISIKIITGSNRPGRFNIQPATWIYELAKENPDISVELLDLQEINLPFLDEAESAKSQHYEKEHTKKWSKTISEADGVIMVTPEYNHSYSAVLKNAIDYIYNEWNFKPVAFVSYGAIVGGSRAVEHLRGVAAELKMYDIREQIVLPNYWNHLDQEGKFGFTEHHEKEAHEMLKSLIFWAEQMNLAREKLV